MADSMDTRTDARIAAPTTRDSAYLERLEANLAIAEQTAKVAREMDDAPAIEFRKPTKLAVSVVIPVYNECDTVVEVVRRVQAVGIHEEIIIVDDYSLDGTRQILLELDREDRVHAGLPGRGSRQAARVNRSPCAVRTTPTGVP